MKINSLKHYYYNCYQQDNIPYEFKFGDAVIYKDEIHILGGVNNGTKHYKLNKETNKWEQDVDLPYEFYNGNAVVIDNNLFLLGGLGNPEALYVFNDEYGWMQLGALPYEFYNGGAIALNDKIHMFGGIGYEDKYTILEIEIIGYNTWITHIYDMECLPFKFCYGSIDICDDEIYLFGSLYDTASYSKHFKLDKNTNKWIDLNNSGNVFYKCIFVNKDILLQLDWYNLDKGKEDLNSGTWHEIVMINDDLISTLENEYEHGSLGGAVLLYNNCIYVIGGFANYTSYGNRFDKIILYKIYAAIEFIEEYIYYKGYDISVKLIINDETNESKVKPIAIYINSIADNNIVYIGNYYGTSLNQNIILDKDIINNLNSGQYKFIVVIDGDTFIEENIFVKYDISHVPLLDSSIGLVINNIDLSYEGSEDISVEAFSDFMKDDKLNINVNFIENS